MTIDIRYLDLKLSVPLYIFDPRTCEHRGPNYEREVYRNLTQPCSVR